MENPKNRFKPPRHNEYEQCWDSWRFFLTFRATLVVLSFTITSGLIYLFFKTDSNGKPLDDFPKFIISFFGLAFTYGIISIQGRNRQMYTDCLNRAIAIELDGAEPPPYKYSETYLKAMWKATKDAWDKFIKTLNGQRLKEEFKNKDVYSYHLATSLNLTPITLFSWMTGGIWVINGMMFLIWCLLLCILTIKHILVSGPIILAIILIYKIKKLRAILLTLYTYILKKPLVAITKKPKTNAPDESK